MILHKLDYLSKKRINLSSKSPRRISLLKDIGLHFENNTLDSEENADRSHVISYVKENARDKLFPSEQFDLNIASDTVVVYQNTILEKPKSIQEAREFLELLSNNTHDVYTGVCLKFKESELLFHEKTEVEFYTLEHEFISSYINSGETLDKAGGYGIQGIGSSFIKSIHGCYYNVMGFPVSLFCKHLNDSMVKGLI